MSSTERRRLARSPSSSSRICACTVTSSAEVGSSATRSSGSAASAMAISARWRMPPLSWCGYCRARSAGSARPTSPRRATARSAAWRADPGRWARIVSATWSPMVSTGLRLVIGSWNTMPIRRPRTRRSASPVSGRRSVPPRQTTLPCSMRPGGGMSCSSARLVRLFPEPDSPTSATVSPCPTVNETPSTGCTRPWRPGKLTRRSRTSSSGVMWRPRRRDPAGPRPRGSPRARSARSRRLVRGSPMGR